MGKEFASKVFRSGNSVAVRLPKALGIAEGEAVRIVEIDDGAFSLTLPERRKGKFNIDKVWGCAIGSGLQPVTDRSFAPRPSSLIEPDP